MWHIQHLQYNTCRYLYIYLFTYNLMYVKSVSSKSVRAQARTSPHKPRRWFLGSGGRECATFWKLKSDPKIELNFNDCIAVYLYSIDMSPRKRPMGGLTKTICVQLCMHWRQVLVT